MVLRYPCPQGLTLSRVSFRPEPFRAPVARLLTVVAVIAAALVAAPAPAATPAAAKYGAKIVGKVNDVRASHGKARLKRDKCLQRFAVRQAKAMASARTMFHQDEQVVISACGLSSYGENIAYGMFTAQEMVHLWMTSEKGHRANILSSGFRVTGAAARHSDGVWWATQVFGSR